jgi:hypothetical protein
MQSAEAIASAISERIQSLPSKRISGTDLAQFLKFSFPDFSPFVFGASRLRVFVERFVPGIIVVGRLGGDLLYGAKPPNPSEQRTETNTFSAPEVFSAPSVRSDFPTSNVPHQVWKSFSSPNSLWHVYANSETGDVQAIAPGNPGLSSPWVVIPPLPAEAHLQVARGFIETVPDEKKRGTLQGLLVQPRWWDRIYSELLQLGLLRSWQFYRRQEILKALSEALRRANIPLKQKPLPYSTPLQPMDEQIPGRGPEQSKPVGDEDLRRVVISAVEKMSIAELRALSIPVGYLIDEFRRES